LGRRRRPHILIFAFPARSGVRAAKSRALTLVFISFWLERLPVGLCRRTKGCMAFLSQSMKRGTQPANCLGYLALGRYSPFRLNLAGGISPTPGSSPKASRAGNLGRSQSDPPINVDRRRRANGRKGRGSVARALGCASLPWRRTIEARPTDPCTIASTAGLGAKQTCVGLGWLPLLDKAKIYLRCPNEHRAESQGGRPLLLVYGTY